MKRICLNSLCRAEFEPKNNRQRYCEKCAKSIRKARKADFMRRKRAEKKQPKEQPKVETFASVPKIKPSDLPQKPTDTVKPHETPKMMPKIQVKQLTHEEYLHRSVQQKLRGQGDYWSMIGTDLTREEKLHISNCDACSKLWAKRGRGFNDLPKSPWEPAESTESEEGAVRTERDRQLNEALREEGFGDYM